MLLLLNLTTLSGVPRHLVCLLPAQPLAGPDARGVQGLGTREARVGEGASFWAGSPEVTKSPSALTALWGGAQDRLDGANPGPGAELPEQPSPREPPREAAAG